MRLQKHIRVGMQFKPFTPNDYDMMCRVFKIFFNKNASASMLLNQHFAMLAYFNDPNYCLVQTHIFEWVGIAILNWTPKNNLLGVYIFR